MPIEMSLEIDMLSESLCNFQKELIKVGKSAENPFFRSKYADLASIMLESQPKLTEHGLVISQFPDHFSNEQGVIPALTTLLLHESGQWIKSTIPLILQKQDPQGVGSAITYMRRYGYAAVLQIVIDEDDDGNKASNGRSVSEKPTKPESSNPETVKKIEEIWKTNGGTPEQLKAWVKKNNNGKILTQLSGTRQQSMLKILEDKSKPE